MRVDCNSLDSAAMAAEQPPINIVGLNIVNPLESHQRFVEASGASTNECAIPQDRYFYGQP
jgi:hypothetical protein